MAFDVALGHPRATAVHGAVSFLTLFFAAAGAWADDTKPADSTIEEFEFGMQFQAQSGAFKSIVGTVTVPAEWPGQQKVRVVHEELPAGATVTYKPVEDMGRQMVIRIPDLAADASLKAAVTFAVERLPPPEVPQDTEHFRLAPRSKPLLPYLSPSPRIESDKPEIHQAAEAAVGERQAAWERVQAVHEWVYQKIRFAGGLENTQGCVATLSLKHGVCAEKNSLAVAMLRALGIPARLVRIPGHVYYEVYLLDGQQQGHWFTGDAAILPTIRPSGESRGLILQKGDNVPIIDPVTKKKGKGRVLSETATGMPQARGAKLSFAPISPALRARPLVPPNVDPADAFEEVPPAKP